MNIVLAGFGSVGRAYARLLALKTGYIEKKYGVKLKIVGILDSRGGVLKEDGFSPYDLLKLCKIPRSSLCKYKPYNIDSNDVREVYSRITPDIHVEATPSNYESGEPGVSNVLYALHSGVNVVLSNKAPLALRYGEVIGLARRKGVEVKFKSTVMAGTPLLDLLNSLKGYDIERIEGILSGTVNYMLSEMHKSLEPYGKVLKKARMLGIVEANPELDVKGWDSAAKLTIISNVIGEPIRLEDVERDDVSKLTLKQVVKAIREGYTIKYIAKLDVRERRAQVKLAKIPREHFFSTIEGTLNAVGIKTGINEILLSGKGAGGVETSYAMLDDTISIALKMG